MRVVLVSMNFEPELTGIGKYSGEMARALAARGHEVHVVCAPPYYPRWAVEPSYRAMAYTLESPAPGLWVHRCPAWVPRRPGGLARVLHLASFAASSLPVLARLAGWRPAVVLTVAPALMCAPAAWLLARISGAKAWLHVQDFEIDVAFALGLLGARRPAQRAIRACESWLLRRFDTVSTLSPRMRQRLIDKGVPAERTALLPNWVDLQAIQPAPVDSDQAVAAQALRSSLGIAAEQTVCLFSGTLNRKHGLDMLLAAARHMNQDPGVVFVICGNGEMREPLQSASAGLTNLRFIDLRPAAELNALLNMADIQLLPQMRGAADLVMPSKLGGMLASGKPVVAAALPGSELARAIDGAGLAFEPESVASMVDALRLLAADPARRARLGAVARRRAEEDWGADRVFDALDAGLAALQGRRGTAASSAGHGAQRHSGHTVDGAAPALMASVRSRRRGAGLQGFTLLELLVVMVIIGLLAAYVGPKYFSQLGQSEVKSARAQIVGFEKALDQFRIDVGRYPSSEQGLAALLTRPPSLNRWNGPYLGKTVPLDPWGHAYQYKAPGERGDVDIVSLGRDGRPGGEGLDADLGNW